MFSLRDFIEEPVEIMDREIKSLKRSRISLVKVRWNSKRGPEFTWEREDYMKSKFDNQSIERDRLIGIGFVLDFVEFISFTFSDKEMILVIKADSGNITKTRSKATPNEFSSLGTTSGGGPRGNTLRSDKDRLKLDELMALCTTLQKKVLDLEKTKTTQANEIASLKRRVKKLENKDRSRTHKLKRLYKVGLTARVESSGDEEDLGEDASKQGRRINAIDADEDITLVNVQDDNDNEMFDVDALNGKEVFVAGKNENVVEEVVDVAQVSTAATTVTITTEEITLAQALEALKTSKPKVKGIVFQEPSTTTTITTISSQQS
ncbi:hypothetical protein Tco_0770216 [Tanacetum coccineum]|uniref:Reverse transcriptase domain-containing protein n=1 Tax=Tanacetum coccineum TaxID=301880 RepID=A0ABQ4ZEW7_9ASTR